MLCDNDAVYLESRQHHRGVTYDYDWQAVVEQVEEEEGRRRRNFSFLKSSQSFDRHQKQKMKATGGGDEETPLLGYRYEGEEDGLQDRPPSSQMVEEAKVQLELGVPVVLMSLLDFSVQVISVAFVGSLGALNLAGAAMASSFANVFGFAILEGLAGGMETSGGQAYGSGQPLLLGYLLQRGQFILIMFCLPISLLYLYAAWVLRHWGQDYEIAALAGQYVMYLLPGLFATALMLPVAKFLQVQGVTKPLAAISCSVLIFHAPVCWFYIHALDMGLVGAAMANSTSNILTLLLLVLFLNFERSGILERSWPGWSLAAFNNLWPFLELALPACAMTSFEWWVWEIIQIMAGWLPHPEISVSAMTICFQTAGLCYMLPLGLGTAASIRVSNELGAQKPRKARLAVIVAIILATAAGGFCSLVLFSVRRSWASVFIDPAETMVIQEFVDVVPILAVSIIGIAWNASLSGILRGSGQQWAGSIVNNLALYGVSLPLAYVFGVKMQMGLQGLWLGMMTGVILQLVGQFGLTGKTDWEYQATRALETVRSNSDQTETKSVD
ncbi:hypothetical protein R1flu_007326 [Riccia fluitans]|uniref:Protein DETOXIFICATION n=1 Tax=Riccia fluitans TaxID=41844 RepID=A0ABD1Z1K5_9MARC